MLTRPFGGTGGSAQIVAGETVGLGPRNAALPPIDLMPGDRYQQISEIAFQPA